MSLKLVPFESLGTVFAFHSNYGSVLYYFRDKARYWSKIAIFSYPLAFDATVRGSLRRNIAIPFGRQKTRMVRLPDGVESLRTCMTVSTEYRRVTDGRTDILHSIAR